MGANKFAKSSSAFVSMVCAATGRQSVKFAFVDISFVPFVSFRPSFAFAPLKVPSVSFVFFLVKPSLVRRRIRRRVADDDSPALFGGSDIAHRGVVVACNIFPTARNVASSLRTSFATCVFFRARASSSSSSAPLFFFDVFVSSRRRVLCSCRLKSRQKKRKRKKRRQKFSNRESSKPPKHVCVCPWTFTKNNNALDYWRRINRRPFRFDEDEDEDEDETKSEYEYREGGGDLCSPPIRLTRRRRTFFQVF